MKSTEVRATTSAKVLRQEHPWQIENQQGRLMLVQSNLGKEEERK